MPITSFAVHPAILNRFQNLVQTGHLGHAYLFIGPQAVGKSETALAIAQFLNCEENATSDHAAGCGTCPACRKIEARQHPDVAMISAGEEATIKIAAIREVIQRLQLKPYEGRTKVVIIENAQLMTAECGNAFLKTLEEPPRDTVLLLTTSSPELLLGTVKSRCQHVYFFPLGQQQVVASLTEKLGMDPKSAHFLAGFTDGCLGRAQQLGVNEFVAQKNTIIDQLLLNKNHDRYLKDLLSDKERIRLTLEIFLTWFRDLVFLKAGAATATLTHVDRVAALAPQAKAYTFAQLTEIISGVENGLKLLDENLNIKIAFYLLMEKIWVR